MQNLESFCNAVLKNIFLSNSFKFINKSFNRSRQKILVLLLALMGSGAANSTDVYFSEYHEPSDNWYNRYIEIYNGSSSTIDLEDYALLYCKDACTTGGLYESVQLFTNATNFPTTTVASGETYVIRLANSNVVSAITNAADGKTGNLYQTGNDPMALVKKDTGFSTTNAKAGNNYTVMDVIGYPQGSSTNWNVCGASNGLANATLVKKEGKQGNTTWSDSRGTSASDCDWVRTTGNDRSNIGQHSPGDSTAPVITLSGSKHVEVALNGTYSDAGATATDDTDGTITGDIATTNGVDTSTAGVYTVKYNVSDAAGNAATTVVRTVTVDPWDFDDSDTHAWAGANDVGVSGGTTYVTLTFGADTNSDNAVSKFPNFDLTNGNIDTSGGDYVAVTLKNNSLNTKYALKVGPNNNWTNLLDQTTNDSEFKTVYFDVSSNAAWSGTKDDLRFRVQEVNGSQGVASGTIFIDEVAVVQELDTTAPTLSSVSLASDNSTSTVAKAGDVVTVTFTASESITTPTVTFTSGGDAITNSPSYNHASGDTWAASYTVASADTDGAVAYSIAFSDTSSNSGTAVTSGTGSVTIDTTAPTLATVTAISTPAANVTPSFVFSSNEAGTITTSISEGFTTSSSASAGNNTITFYTLSDGTYTGETVTVTDSTGNAKSLTIPTFVIDSTGPIMAITSSMVSSGDTSNDASIVLTFTSSEATTDFDESDIAESGGSISNFSGSGTSYSATFTPSADGATTIDVAASAFTDSLGNNNSAASQFNWTYDGTAPSLASVTAVSTPGNDSTPSFVFSSDEAGTITTSISEGFSTSSSASSGNNTITFSSLSDGTYSGKTVTVTDASGNAGSVTIADFTIETVAPTVSIASSTVSDGDTSNDESIALTFTSNEATTNFVVGDVTVSGGSLSNFAASSSSVYTATFTPSSAGATSIDVGASVFTDAAGNGNTAASQFNWTFDNSSAELSNVSISSNNATSTLAKASDVITLIFSANETIDTPTVTFASGGSTIASGRVSVSNTSGNNWSASYTTGASDSDGAVTYSIAFSDTGGNAGVPVISGSGSVTFDNTRPVSSISSAQVGNGGATNAGSIAVVFGLSDSTTEFSAADVSISGGSLSDFSGNGTSYSATFTPDGDGTKTIQIVRAAYTDAAGNVSWATGEFSFAYDGTFPTIDVSNMYSKIIDGMTDLGTATADEDVTWSISGTGVSISSTGTVTLDTAADHLVAESHTFTISAMDNVGNNRHVTMTVEVGDVTAPTIDYSNLVQTIDEGKTALGYVTSTETVTWSIEGIGVSISSSGVVTLDSPASYADASYHSYRVTATDEEGIFREGFSFTVFVNDTTAPVITLVGSASVESELGYTYTDEGATALDNKDGTITSEITTVNSVDVDNEGTYTITYDVTDASGNAATQVVRTVTVTPDATIPVITLTGDSSVTVEGATSYSDDGASATDNIDGDLSSSITTVSNVDIKIPGTYTITYNVSDAAGNAAAEVSRTVKVVDTTAPVITLSGGSEGTSASSPYSTNDPVGNGADGQLNTADDAIIKDLYVVEGLTFVRPPLGGEAAASTWGNAAGRDLVRVGTNRYFRKFTWQKASDWCASVNGRLATGAEVTTHIAPIVGPNSNGVWESELNWPQQASHYWTGSVAGDDDGTESRHKAFITYNTGNGNSVHQLQGRANTNAFWPLCLIETEAATEGSAEITHEQGTAYTDEGATALDSLDGVVPVETSGTVDVSLAGTYVLTYTATDNAGNSATKDRSVTVTDTISPLITLIGEADISLEQAPSGTTFDDPGATATDGGDGDISANITVTGAVDLTTVGTYVLTYSVTDLAGNVADSVTRTITVTPDVTIPVITLLGDSSITIERLTVYSDEGATASDNIDGDITSSIVSLGSVDSSQVGTYVITYNVNDSGGNAAIEVSRIINVVPIAVSMQPPMDISINATGHLTSVDLGSATVSGGEGDISVMPSVTGPFESGMYEVVWTAQDSVGTSASVTQILKVMPMVNLGPAITTTEGNNLQIPVILSGHLADSSMSVSYSLSGTAAATDDYLSNDTSVMIEGSEMAAMINIDIVADTIAESDETLTITLMSETLIGAGPGSKMEQTITISEQDLPPKVSMHASQASIMPITTVAKDSGIVDVVASPSDPNAGSNFTYIWSSYSTLPGAVDNGDTLSFDPSTMDSGVISIPVEVSDGVNSTIASVLLNVIDSMPALSVENDTDGDGTDDLTEGLGDDDTDGIPNYLDGIMSSNVVPTASSFAQSEAGTSLSLGSIALGNNDNDITVSEGDIAAADVGFDYMELSDFVISGAEPGHSYKITIPLSVPSSSTATYRKYVNENIGWQMFVEDASNMIMSADSSNGVCPAAGSEEYGPGWYIGDDCLQLMIEDGGPNDADGLANGAVIDPSGVAEKFIGTPSSNSSAVLGTSTLDANGTDSTSVTVTVLDASGSSLEHMNVSGTIGISGATVSSFYEEGEGVYTATVTAGTVAGSDTVSIVVSNGQTSITISSDQLTLNDVTPVTPEEPTSSGGGGCTVSTDNPSDNTLIIMLLAAVLLLIRRRYCQNL